MVDVSVETSLKSENPVHIPFRFPYVVRKFPTSTNVHSLRRHGIIIHIPEYHFRPVFFITEQPSHANQAQDRARLSGYVEPLLEFPGNTTHVPPVTHPAKFEYTRKGINIDYMFHREILIDCWIGFSVMNENKLH